jgi:hypothetical protein
MGRRRRAGGEGLGRGTVGGTGGTTWRGLGRPSGGRATGGEATRGEVFTYVDG